MKIGHEAPSNYIDAELKKNISYTWRVSSFVLVKLESRVRRASRTRKRGRLTVKTRKMSTWNLLTCNFIWVDYYIKYHHALAIRTGSSFTNLCRYLKKIIRTFIVLVFIVKLSLFCYNDILWMNINKYLFIVIYNLITVIMYVVNKITYSNIIIVHNYWKGH